jgi:hypothetical protein
MAVGLMAALTYAYVKDSRENFSAQSAVRIAEELFVQANLIRSAVQQCAMEFPQGGGNMDNTGGSAGVIDAADNPNNPYPVKPTFAFNPHGVAGDDTAKNLTCTGAPTASASMFQGTNNQGRFLPPPPSGFSEWVYKNDANGVYLQTTGPQDAAAINALGRLMSKFNTCQADLNYGACGARCFAVWVQRNVCP